MPQSQQLPAGDSVRSLHLSDFDLRFDRYRLIQPKADLLMARSIAKYSQIAPVVYCQLEGSLVLVDGFKRLRAARTLKGITSLEARLLEVDEQAAKAAIFNLNLVTSKPNELEESWIIFALVHDDGLPQIEVAQMLGRHKSWVNRRLALIERLTDQAREALRLGLLSPTQAHHLTQLQRCNQNAAMQCATEHALTSRELSETVRLLQSASTQEQTQFVLEKPRDAIRQSQETYVHQWDPRLSTAGNRAAKRLGFLLDATLILLQKTTSSLAGRTSKAYAASPANYSYSTLRTYIKDRAAATCLYDNMKVVVTRWEDGQPIYNLRFLSFATHYGFKPWACEPRRPETKGKIERPFDYAEKNLLNGRTFRSLAHLNEVARWWLAEVNDRRIHGTTKRSPLEVHEEEKPYLIDLPAIRFDTSTEADRPESPGENTAIFRNSENEVEGGTA